METAEQEYPELNIIAGILERIALQELNKIVPNIKTKCPYPAQCTLELLIERLKAKV